MDVTQPRLLRFDDSTVRWGANPRSDEPGFAILSYTQIEGTNFMSHISVLPRGTRRPSHRHDAEHLMVALEGEVEFEFPDLGPTATVRMKPFDVVFVPADLDYRYRQVGQRDAAFSATVIRKEAWPCTGSGFDRDPLSTSRSS